MGVSTGNGSVAPRLFARSWRLSLGGRPDASALRDLVDVLIPQIAELDGYQGGFLLVDRGSGDILATTFWDSLANLEAGQVRAANAAAGTLVISDGSAMQVSVCDVLYSDPVQPFLSTEARADKG